MTSAGAQIVRSRRRPSTIRLVATFAGEVPGLAGIGLKVVKLRPVVLVANVLPAAEARHEDGGD